MKTKILAVACLVLLAACAVLGYSLYLAHQTIREQCVASDASNVSVHEFLARHFDGVP